MKSVDESESMGSAFMMGMDFVDVPFQRLTDDFGDLFAAALAGIGLPKGNLFSAPFLFNIGVEGGQLLVITIGLNVAWIARSMWRTTTQFLVRVPLYLVGSTAAYLVVERRGGLFREIQLMYASSFYQ